MSSYAAPPDGFAILWSPGPLSLHVLSESLTALAYLLILAALVRIARGGRDGGFGPIFFCFAGLLAASGVSHATAAGMARGAGDRASEVLEAATAAVSLAALAVFWRLRPAIFAEAGCAETEGLNRRLNRVLNDLPMCAFTVDGRWTIDYMNDRARRVLSPMGKVHGKKFDEAFPHVEASAGEHLLRVMTTREATEFETYYEPLKMSLSVSAHPSEDGGITIFFCDISDRKQAERQMHERALHDQRLAVLARFSASLAHEIKNPLAIIHARASDLAEAAEAGALPAELVERTCASIVKISDRTTRILHGLEAQAHDAAQDIMQQADAGTIVEQTVELVERRFQTHGILLKTIVPDGLPLLDCREVQIGQVLLNLLNNAFDAVDASPDSERWVSVEVCLEKAGEGLTERVQIDVVDGGPALTEETKQHLMDAFYTTKPMGGGIGLGLSVSEAIAKQHGGTLELGFWNRHTCLRLTLPVHAPAPAEKAAA